MTEPTHPLVDATRPVVDAVGATFIRPEEAEASDVPLVWNGQTVGAVRLPPLHGALDRLIDAVQTELGGELPGLSREDLLTVSVMGSHVSAAGAATAC